MVRAQVPFTGFRQIALETIEVTFDVSMAEFNFIPGQYVTIALHEQETLELNKQSHDFSICSSPHELPKLTTAFVKSESIFKTKLLQMHQGELVFIEGPKGEFILPQTAHQPICFIAEGIGITPFISMIRYVVHNNLDHKITLFYYNNSQKTEAYKDELRTYKSKIALKEVYGHLTNETLQITGNETALWFIAGPVDMVDSAKNILRMNTIDERNIKTEKITGYE